MARRSIKKRLLNTRAIHGCFSLIASILMRLIYLSCRVEKRIPETLAQYVSGNEPAIFCFWHGRMIMQPFVKPPGRPMMVLISHHNDGALITATMRRFRIDSVRGSKKLGGAQALRTLFTITQARGNIAITPDGPRGPFQQAASGAAYVAAKTGYPLIPVTFSARRHWRFRSWDKFMLPKFFTRVLFVVGMPMTVSSDDTKTLQKATADLQEALVRLTIEADQACGVAP